MPVIDQFMETIFSPSLIAGYNTVRLLTLRYDDHDLWPFVKQTALLVTHATVNISTKFKLSQNFRCRFISLGIRKPIAPLVNSVCARNDGCYAIFSQSQLSLYAILIKICDNTDVQCIWHTVNGVEWCQPNN